MGVTDVTIKKREKFLTAYAELGTISHAAARTGISRMTVYRWLEDESFKSAFEGAKKEVVDKLEREAIRRATEGVDKPVYYKGELVDTIREYSDTLLIFLLKGQKPDIYGDKVRQEVTGKDGEAVKVVFSIPRPERGKCEK